MKKYLIKLPDSFKLKGSENPLEDFIKHFAEAAECSIANIKSDILYEIIYNNSNSKGTKIEYYLCGNLSDECYKNLIENRLMSEESLISKEKYEEMLSALNNDNNNYYDIINITLIKFSNKGVSLTKIYDRSSSKKSAKKDEECIIL